MKLIRIVGDRKYTKEEIESILGSRNNSTARTVRAMANGAKLELTQMQLDYIRKLGIEPTLVGSGIQTNISQPGRRPVYRGSTKGVYTIEVE